MDFRRRLNEDERHGALSTVRGFAGMSPSLLTCLHHGQQSPAKWQRSDSSDFRDRRRMRPQDRPMAFRQDEDRRGSLGGQARLHPHVGQRGPQAEAAKCPEEREDEGGLAARA